MDKYYVRVKGRILKYFDDIDEAKAFALRHGARFRIPRKRKKLSKLNRNKNRR